MIYAPTESKSLANFFFCQPRLSLSLIMPYQAITNQVLKELLMLPLVAPATATRYRIVNF